MTNQNGGHYGEAEFKPSLDAPNLSGRTRTAPVIEGEAVEITPQEITPQEAPSTREAENLEKQAEFFSEQQAGLPAEAPTAADDVAELKEEQAETFAEQQAGLNAETPAVEAHESAEPPAEPVASMDAAPQSAPAAKAAGGKSAVFGSFAALVGLLVLGGGSYYGWRQMHQPKPDAAPQIATLPTEAPAEKPPAVTANDKAAAEAEPTAPHENASVVAAPAEPAPKTEDKALPPHDAEATPVQESARPQVAMEKAENPTPSNAGASHAASEASPGPAAAPNAAMTETVLAPVVARLDHMQEAVDGLAQRMQKVEAQLAAPKSEARADTSARGAGPANASEASSRVVIAQSLLTAVRQGDDGAAMLAALETSGANPSRLNSLRAGLAAPTPAKLAAEFRELAPRLLASVEPAAAKQEPPQGAAAGLLAFVESRAKKLVRVRPVGAADEEGLGGNIEHIEAALDHGDLATALNARAALPEQAQAISADWARSAQARLDAESAAKAELTDALNLLGKRKS